MYLNRKRYVCVVLCSICVAAFLPHVVLARPISYAGGWTVMQNNNAERHSLHFHYSPAADHSIGYRGEYWRDEDWQFHGVQVNYLVKRWNEKTSQGNIYLKAAGGLVITESSAVTNSTDNIDPGGFVGIAADWEDRRFFVSYENKYYSAGDFDSFFIQEARVGVAPYIGEYGDLHTWLMLQVYHRPDDDEDEWEFTPIVRFFKDVYLAEFGVSDEGDVTANFVMRF